MRLNFVAGLFLGSSAVFLCGVAMAARYFPPPVENYPEFRRECQKRQQAETERDALRRELTLLELDMLRRKNPNAVNPNGVDVPEKDRIPAPKEPLPIPTNPLAK